MASAAFPRRTIALALACALLATTARAEAPASSTNGAGLRIAWPRSGRVRVPLRWFHDQVIVEARVGGRAVRAILDSAASVAVIDEAAPLAATMRVTGGRERAAGSTAPIDVRLGEIDGITLGGVALDGVAAARVPMPQLAALAPERPELLLGLPLFLAAAVRIDLDRKEVILAPSGTPLSAAGASAIPIALDHARIVVPIDLEGMAARMQLDTGSDAGLLLYAPWARAHGLPGQRPTTERRGHFGAGSRETVEIELHLSQAALGPIVARDVPAKIVDPPVAGDLAGLLGNGLIGACRAFTLDASAGRLYLDPPCRVRVRRERDSHASDAGPARRRGKSPPAR